MKLGWFHYLKLPYAYRQLIPYDQILKPAHWQVASILATQRYTREWQNASLLIFMTPTWVHRTSSIYLFKCFLVIWVNRVNSVACLSCQRSLRTFVFPGEGGNCREQHHLFLQDVEMPRKLGNKQNFWRMNCDFVILHGVNYVPLTPSASKMWYTYLPLLTDYRTALETTFPKLQKHFYKHFFQHEKGLDFNWLLSAVLWERYSRWAYRVTWMLSHTQRTKKMHTHAIWKSSVVLKNYPRNREVGVHWFLFPKYPI